MTARRQPGADVDRHVDRGASARADLDDPAAEDVEDAGLARLGGRERHVARPHADPEAVSRRKPETRHAQDAARHRELGEPVGPVVALHRRVQHRAGRLDSGQGIEIEPRHDLRRRDLPPRPCRLP